MKIAMFHFGFFYSGGGEKLVLEEMRGLRKQGHHVELFAPFVDRILCFPDIPEMADVHTLLPSPPKWLPLRHAIWVLACCVLIPAIAVRFRSFDIFFAANQPAPWFAFVLARILRKPYVIYLAQPFRLLHPRRIDIEKGLRIKDGDQALVKLVTKLGRRFIDFADRASVVNATAVLTNGEYVGEWIYQVYGVRNQVCSAACHPIAEEENDYQARWKGEIIVKGSRIVAPYMLLTNRHAPQKKFEYALWALKAIHQRVPNLSLVVTGQETKYTDQLRHLTESLNLEGKVHFVGLISEECLRRLYRRAVVYVYPSPEEDFGMGVVEAMGARTPVVAWANGGPTVTVKDGVTGYLVEPYDTEAFAERIHRLATDAELAERMGRAAHKRACTFFSYERHNQILERVLRRAVSLSPAGVDAEVWVGDAVPFHMSREEWVPQETISPRSEAVSLVLHSEGD